MDIQVGQIWEVTSSSFLTSGENTKFNRQVMLKKGEFIEIRYPYEWHFRTEDDFYFHCNPETILLNCKFIGTIYEEIRFKKNAKLEEILRLELYEK